MPTTTNIRYGISPPETVYNDIKSLSSEYTALESTDADPRLPNQEKENDANVAGRGQEGLTQQFGLFYERPQFTFSDRLSADRAFLHARRALGGTDVVTGGGVPKTHTVKQIDSTATLQLPSANIYDSLLAADYSWMGCCAGSFSIQHQGAAVPTYSVNYVGSGKHRRIREISVENGYAQNFGALATPTPPVYTKRAPSPVLTWNDGTSYDIAAAGIMRSFSMSVENNLLVDDKRIGDPYNLAGASAPEITSYGFGDVDESGWVQNHLEIGERTASAQIVVSMEATALRHFDAMKKDTTITNLDYQVTGAQIPSGSGARYTFGLKFPKCFVSSTVGGKDGNRPIVTISLVAAFDTSAQTQVTAMAINASSTVVL